jgi:hypothetical protein
MKTLTLAFFLSALSVFAQCPSAPAFPSAIATDANLILAKNNISTVLLAAMASTDSVAVVINPTGWVANMPASVDKEIVFVIILRQASSGLPSRMVSGRMCI